MAINLTDWQNEFLDSLREENWTIEEPPADVELEESEKDKLRNEIESSPDCERLIIRPSGEDNKFNNISAEVLRSKIVDTHIIFLYKYKSLKRNEKLVGREGGVCEVIISKYSSEDLEKQYSVIEEI